MLGAMMGGGMSASSGASASQTTSTESGFGAFNAGGFNYAPQKDNTIMQLALIGGAVFVGYLLLNRKK